MAPASCGPLSLPAGLALQMTLKCPLLSIPSPQRPISLKGLLSCCTPSSQPPTVLHRQSRCDPPFSSAELEISSDGMACSLTHPCNTGVHADYRRHPRSLRRQALRALRAAGMSSLSRDTLRAAMGQAGHLPLWKPASMVSSPAWEMFSKTA